MEPWQIVIAAYCGIAVMWCLYMLYRYRKLQKGKEKNLFFIFLLVFLLVMVAMTAHICYLMGSFVLGYPIFIVIGLMILTTVSIQRRKK